MEKRRTNEVTLEMSMCQCAKYAVSKRGVAYTRISTKDLDMGGRGSRRGVSQEVMNLK